MNAKTKRAVRERAGGMCEYCRLPDRVMPEPFSTDHIVAEQHGGATSQDNLAYACASCNRHKGPNIAGLDPASGSLVPLFNPRKAEWQDHFRFEGPILVGTSPIGRATVIVLNVNDPESVVLRELLIRLGEFLSLDS
jgi:hypothetical protein